MRGLLSPDADAAAVRIPPPLVYALAITLGWLLQRPWPLMIPEWLLSHRWLLAAVPGVPGLVLLGAAAWLFLRSGQNPEPWKTTPSIVVDGVYRFSRNPMYVAMALLQLAAGAALGNAWIVLLAPLSLLVVYRIAVRHEERYLEQKFGDAYVAYKQRVRRWL